MRVEKDQQRDEIVLFLKEHEYLIVLAALKAATADDAPRGPAYTRFYHADKGDVVQLHNAIDEAEREA